MNKLDTYQLQAIVIIILFYAGGRLILKDHDYLRLQFLGARNAWLGCPYSVCDLRTCPSININHTHVREKIFRSLVMVLKAVQLSLVSKFDCVICRSITPGWGVHSTIAVTKGPALVRLLKVVTLVIIDAMEKYSEYMLVGGLMDKKYTMVMW